MAARCCECEELVSSQPYEDERLASSCSCCETPMCEDCVIRLGGICTACHDALSAP